MKCFGQSRVARTTLGPGENLAANISRIGARGRKLLEFALRSASTRFVQKQGRFDFPFGKKFSQRPDHLRSARVMFLTVGNPAPPILTEIVKTS